MSGTPLQTDGAGDRPGATGIVRGKPSWLRKPLPSGPAYGDVCRILASRRLHTVCREAGCPNRFECFGRHTATFLILGPHCTRGCRFCHVRKGPPAPVDPEEPSRVAAAAAALGLSYAVVTSVTRDDLDDGGAQAFADAVCALRGRIPGVRVEVLVPDFRGSADALERLIAAGPDVLNHNIETVPGLYGKVRPQASYGRSLDLLQRAAERSPGMPVKSGLMLGLGERRDEVCRTLRDLRDCGCRILTMGQYLQPSPDTLPVARFVPPEEFAAWRQEALSMGFAGVAAGPFVRSSYRAGDLFREAVAGSEP